MTSSGVSSSIAGLLRVTSWIICLIVAASFLVFVVEQTNAASAHQQAELDEHPVAGATPKSSKQESGLHKALDEAANVFTSPFSGVVSGSSSQWAIHGIETLLALLVYGLGLGYLARVLRVRV
ncbi:MAG TPA: hypothetical protein VFC30_04375 [Solirubrobacteraceae bacterium]|nr:hypothetical protein [Solirubrobacteraceae bacterium]